MGLLRVITGLIGFAMFAFGGMMTIACIYVAPAMFRREESLSVAIVGQTLAVGSVAVLAWVGWRVMRWSPAKPSVSAPAATPASSAAGSSPTQQAPAEITVVVQNQAAPTPPSRHVVHLRCRHCGTTTPESEQHCEQCGALLR